MEDSVAGVSSTSTAGHLSRRNRFLVPSSLQTEFLVPSSLQTELAGESVDSPRALFDQVSCIRKTLEQLQRAQNEGAQPLRDFIHQELQALKSSLLVDSKSQKAQGVQELTEESLRKIVRQELQALASSVTPVPQILEGRSGIEDIQKGLERHGNCLQDIVKRLNTLSSSPHNMGTGQEDSKRAEVKGEEEEEGGSGRLLPANNIELIFQDIPDDEAGPKWWHEFQDEIDHADKTCVYQEVLHSKLAQRSFWHDVFDYFGIGRFIYQAQPTNWAAEATRHWAFTTCQTLLILANTVIMGYETDVSIKAVLQEPKGDAPDWLDTCNLIFNITFAAELFFRLAALGTWFWVCPSEWGWNFFDFFLVISSLLSDMLNGINFSFIRTFRVLRAVRAARIIRMLRVFRQLRQMLFSILAALTSLIWAFIFLGMIMFMFAILFLQGSLNMLEDSANRDEHVLDLTREWWGSLGGAMFSLLASVTGGIDWITVRAPLTYAGDTYSAAFVGYMLFVTVGVMNVLTGVFLTSAHEFLDLDLIVQNEQIKVDTFCEQMMELFFHMDVSQTGLIDWPTFDKALQTDHVRHFLASLRLEPTHVKLIFDLLDADRSGKISIEEFLMGMVRLKGEAKAVDARIIQRELGMIPRLLKSLVKRQVPEDQAI